MNNYDNDAHSTLYHEPIRYLTHIFCVGAPKVYITPNVFIALHNSNRGVWGDPPLEPKVCDRREHLGEEPAAKRGGLGGKAPHYNAAGTG